MEKRKCPGRILSVLICMMLAVCMSFGFSESVFAAGEEAFTAPAAPLAGSSDNYVLNSGASITALEYANADTAPVYSTPELTNSSADFTYNVAMPQKGTLVIQYAVTAADADVYINAEGGGASYAGTANFDSTQGKLYCVPSAGNVSLGISVYSKNTPASVIFTVWYVGDGKTVGTGKTNLLVGSAGTNAVSTFKVKVPSNGYLSVSAASGLDSYGISMRATGFKGWEYLSSTNGFSRNIGVKKGTYTISLKGAAIYEVSTSFHKVKETSAKKTKKKAASIKKGKLNKGIIPANSRKKVHWYKIKNPKNQKLTLAVNAKKMSGGGGYGNLKITVYFPDKTSRYANINAGVSDQLSVTYGKIGTKKARKGTYYVKVVSTDGANGYYTLKWK